MAYRQKPMHWYSAIGWAILFATLLAVCIWGLFFPPTTKHHHDCPKIQDLFAVNIGHAVLAQSEQDVKDLNSYNKASAKIIFSAPECFNDTLISEAKASIGQ